MNSCTLTYSLLLAAAPWAALAQTTFTNDSKSCGLSGGRRGPCPKRRRPTLRV